MSVNVCQHCGTEVLWRRRQDGSMHPPLTAIGNVLTITEQDRVGQVSAYIKHVCDPTQIARWEAHKERQAEGRREDQSRMERQANEREEDRKQYLGMRESAYRRAAKVDCPRCPAKEAEECLNLNTIAGRGRGKKHTSWPHPERVLLAEQEGH